VPAHPPIQSVLGVFPGRKAAGPELNYLPTGIAKVKNERSLISASPPPRMLSWCARGFYLYLYNVCALFLSIACVRNIFRPDTHTVALEMFSLTHLDPLTCPHLSVFDQNWNEQTQFIQTLQIKIS